MQGESEGRAFGEEGSYLQNPTTTQQGAGPGHRGTQRPTRASTLGSVDALVSLLGAYEASWSIGNSTSPGMRFEAFSS